MRSWSVRWLGRVPYGEALELQQSTVEAVRRGSAGQSLLLLEHPPVVTLGRSSHTEHLLASPEQLARRGVELFETGRGGDVTYHGPGQLVGYPIIALEGPRRDAHRYLRDLEEALIRTVADFGVQAGREDSLTGIWVGQAKLAAIGVRLSSGWITSHGFALNVSTDLDGFSDIVPCGLRGREVTSLDLLIAEIPPMRRVAAHAAHHLSQIFELQPIPASVPEQRLAMLNGGTVC